MRSLLLRFCPGLLLAVAAASAAPAPDFVREVYPVLQRACFECHDARKTKGGLRLDDRAEAFKGGDKGHDLVPGRPEASEVLRRLTLPRGDDEAMPSRGEPLPAPDIEKIRAWIATGAPWPEGVKPAPHWAYVKPVKAALPQPGSHPVDAFVRARLIKEGLSPAPQEELPVLARRLYLDLIGLPPTPAQVDAFTHAASTNTQAAVEKLADDLLRSPQYGEKWARPWLDAARYGDSHGFQRDDLHDLWPYRDWVIKALNADMAFDQFTIEQLAGDLLPNATEQQRIATGFNRCAPCNCEAGTDPEENRVNQVFDRVNTLGAVWLGTTLECAQCHDHKYDPITKHDYYGLFAFFNQTELEADRSNPKVPGSIRFLGPYMQVSLPEHDAEEQRLKTEIAKIKQAKANNQKVATSTPASDHVLTPDDFESTGDGGHKVLEDGSILLLGDPPAIDTYTITVRTPLKGITGFKLEALTDPALPGSGPGRGDPQRTNFVLNSCTVTAAPMGHEAEAKEITLTDGRADFTQAGFNPNQVLHNNDKRHGWAIGPRFHQPHWAAFRTQEPVGFEGGTVLTFKLVQNFGNARTIGRVRLSALTGGELPVAAKQDDTKATLAALEKELAALPPSRSLVMQTNAQPRTSTMFQRGDFRAPGDAIEPCTPAVLNPLNPTGSRDRLALARWLVSRDNPLVARVVVNRLWTELFGEGLVSTPEDFGVKGELPSHPELLDWLAVDFMEHGWSQKQVLRRIVTSATYRQSSRQPADPAVRERDPRNRLLACGPRFRLTAEGIRDNALSIAGLINLKSYGPPIHPPQPEGLWTKVGGVQYEYKVSPGDEQYRRGVYVVLKRMSPYPSFTTFDATARLSCRVKRLRSNTPLQALALLNDPVYVEAAHAFAARVLKEVPESDVDMRLRHAFRLAVARAPTAAELKVLRGLLDRELAAGNEEAAWFAVTTALLNLDETITKS